MSTSEFEDEDGEGYFASVSDLMVGILFVFLLMLTVFALNFRDAEDDQKVKRELLDKARADTMEAQDRARFAEHYAIESERDAEQARSNAEDERRNNEKMLALLKRASEQINQDIDDRRDARRRLIGRLQKTLLEQGVAVIPDPNSEVLRLPESLLFKVGKPTLDGQDAISALDKVSSALAEILPCYVGNDVRPACDARDRSTLEGVLVEGHSDPQPYHEVGKKFSEEQSRENNDNLSVERALTVFKEMLPRNKLDEIKNAQGVPVFGVSAYGSRRLVKKSDGTDDYQQSRRIDLRFMLSEHLSTELQKLVAEIKALGAAQ